MYEEQPGYPVTKEPRPLLDGVLEAQPGPTESSSFYEEQLDLESLSPNS